MPQVKKELLDIKLWVVGDFGEDKSEYLSIIREKKIENDVIIRDGYIPDREVETYFVATDLVVLPYTSATQSGIAQIAYGFEKAVVATNVGGLPDVIEDGKTGYIVEKKNEKELAAAIVRFFKDNKAQEFADNIKIKADEFSWKTMVKRIEGLMNK